MKLDEERAFRAGAGGTVTTVTGRLVLMMMETGTVRADRLNADIALYD